MVRTDVAIYSPAASGLYDESSGRPVGGVGVQTSMLARQLARHGMKVAHIVFPLDGPPVDLPPGLILVERPPFAGRRRLREARRMWRALREADAAAYVIRGRSPAVGVLALFCAFAKRKLIFASAVTSDFTLEGVETAWHVHRSFRFGVKHANAVIVQTPEQVDMARSAFPKLRTVVEIPSFTQAAPPSSADPIAFVWLGRLVPSKQPLKYVELARALPEALFWMITTETSETPPGMAAELREAARGVPNLQLLEPRPHREVGELLDRAVASVNTSLLEGMPNVFLEAWGRGVPALSLHVDPGGRIKREGLGVAAAGSWGDFVAGARELWRGRHAREALALRARDYIARVHSPESVARQWMSVLEALGVRK